MVYLRVPTLVFYIIQTSGYRISTRGSFGLPLVSISALQFVSEVGRQGSTVFVEPARFDGRYRHREGTGHPVTYCGEHPDPWDLRVRLHNRSPESDLFLR